MAYTATKTILDGQVTLTVKGRTANVASKIRAFETAIPHDGWETYLLNHFWNCALTFPATVSIEFNLTEQSPPALFMWREFWEAWGGSQDYPAVWEAYADALVIEAGNAWYQVVIEANEIEYLAPIQLQQPEGELDAKNG